MQGVGRGVRVPEANLELRTVPRTVAAQRLFSVFLLVLILASP